MSQIEHLLKLVPSFGFEHTDDHQLYSHLRLVNVFAPILGLIVVLWGIIFKILHAELLFWVCCTFGGGYILLPLLNKCGHISLSRLLMVIMGNTIITIHSIYLGRESHIFMYFILMTAYPFLFFTQKEKPKIFASIAITAISVGVYFTSNFVISTKSYLTLTTEAQFLVAESLFLTLLVVNGLLIWSFYSATSKMELQLIDANQKIKQSTANLIQAEKLSAIGELTASITHELNQPLNVIMIITQTILRDIEKQRFNLEAAQKDLPQILNQINRMANIIDHMRAYTRRTDTSIMRRLDINDVVQNSLELTRQQLKNHSIEVQTDLAQNLKFVKGDAIRLEQVFINFISNARHAVENNNKKEMIISLKTHMQNSDMVAIEIWDNGTGISEEDKNKIFEPFFTSKDIGLGTGLGLSISKQIIEEHKGSISFDTQKGEFTVFKIHLPTIE